MTTSAAALRFTKGVENVRRDVGIADMKKRFEPGSCEDRSSFLILLYGRD